MDSSISGRKSVIGRQCGPGVGACEMDRSPVIDRSDDRRLTVFNGERHGERNTWPCSAGGTRHAENRRPGGRLILYGGKKQLHGVRRGTCIYGDEKRITEIGDLAEVRRVAMPGQRRAKHTCGSYLRLGDRFRHLMAGDARRNLQCGSRAATRMAPPTGNIWQDSVRDIASRVRVVRAKTAR